MPQGPAQDQPRGQGVQPPGPRPQHHAGPLMWRLGLLGWPLGGEPHPTFLALGLRKGPGGL